MQKKITAIELNPKIKLKPPRKETTMYYYMMLEYKRRQKQNKIEIGNFT